ncbi:GWxTD domain-containing protein [Bacteroidota bacterium]
MLKFISGVFSLVLLLNTFCMGQDNFGFEFDYARFNYDTSSVYMEFYYSFDQRSLSFTETQDGYLLEAILHLEMQNIDTGEDYINRDWKVPNVVTDTASSLIDKNLVGQIAFVIPKGNYKLLARGSDINNAQAQKEVNETIIVQPYSTDRLAISDVELATHILREGADQNSIFYKNTLEVTPNPAMLYSESSPILFYYTEIYNLGKQSAGRVFKFQKALYNSRGYTVYEGSKYISSEQNSIVEVGLLNLSKYPSDTYNLILSVIDTLTSDAVFSSKRFYLYNPGVEDTFSEKLADLGYLESEYSVITENECDDQFEKAYYVMNGDQKDEYDKLTSLEAKRKFLYNFWKSQDMNPTTVKNEFKELYFKRVNYSNENFKSRYKEGFLTDRGRVYILYGPPDNVDYSYSDMELKPNETWYYNSIEAGVQFIFGNITGFNYELIHSTKRGEVNDVNWEERLRMTP